MKNSNVKNFDVVVAGHLCVDIYPGLDEFKSNDFLQRLKPGKLLYVGDASFATGGPVSNTGLAFHNLGVSTCLLGKIGQDAFGQSIIETINRYGKDLAQNLIISEKEGSSYTIILNPPKTDRMFLHYPGTNDTFTAEDIDYSVVSKCKIFHFGYPPLMRKMYEDDGDNLTELMKRAKKTKVLTSLDMALPDPESNAGRAKWFEILKKALPYVDIFLPSIEEIMFMLDRPLYDKLMGLAVDGDIIPLIKVDHLAKISRQLLAYGPKILGLKLGDRGFYVKTRGRKDLQEFEGIVPISSDDWANREIWAPCFQVNLKGTTGSGDSTIAGFLTAILKGEKIDFAVQMAVAVGACSVETLDSASGIQPWDKTKTRIENGWARKLLSISDKNWKQNTKYEHWERKNGS